MTGLSMPQQNAHIVREATVIPEGVVWEYPTIVQEFAVWF